MVRSPFRRRFDITHEELDWLEGQEPAAAGDEPEDAVEQHDAPPVVHPQPAGTDRRSAAIAMVAVALLATVATTILRSPGDDPPRPTARADRAVARAATRSRRTAVVTGQAARSTTRPVRRSTVGGRWQASARPARARPPRRRAPRPGGAARRRATPHAATTTTGTQATAARSAPTPAPVSAGSGGGAASEFGFEEG